MNLSLQFYYLVKKSSWNVVKFSNDEFCEPSFSSWFGQVKVVGRGIHDSVNNIRNTCNIFENGYLHMNLINFSIEIFLVIYTTCITYYLNMVKKKTCFRGYTVVYIYIYTQLN